MKSLKKFVKENEMMMNFVSMLSYVLGNNKIKAKTLKCERKGSFSKGLRVIDHGNNNVLKIGRGCRLYDCRIEIFGSDNCLNIEEDCELRNVDIWLSDGGAIEIGHNTWFTGKIHIACIENTKVKIGQQCLFSNEITIRTGDSHSILDESGTRINSSKDIQIGEHVWIGQKVTILKGANIGDGSVVGTGAIVTGKKYQPNSILAGSPAKVIKDKITWNHQLL